MKIIVTAQGDDLDAPASPRFGRCSTYILVETETMAYEAIPNPAISAAGGAGIQAAQFIVEQGAQAVLTGNVGPNAAGVLQAANVPIYLNNEVTVRAAVEAFQAGRLSVAAGANVADHAGMGMGQRRGMGRGQRQPAPSTANREKEVADLKDIAGNLRQQLADVIDRIEKLEKEN